MTKPLSSLCLALFLIASPLSGNDPAVVVSRVVDGDTLVLSDGRRVRLIGVDTPEHHPSAKLRRDAARTQRDAAVIREAGKRATRFVRAIIEGREARIELDPVNKVRGHRDRYGRVLAYVRFKPVDCGELSPLVAEEVCGAVPYEEGFLNALILYAGYAHAYTRFPFKHLEEFRRLEREAREEGRGLWKEEDWRSQAPRAPKFASTP